MGTRLAVSKKIFLAMSEWLGYILLFAREAQLKNMLFLKIFGAVYGSGNQSSLEYRLQRSLLNIKVLKYQNVKNNNNVGGIHDNEKPFRFGVNLGTGGTMRFATL